MSGAALNHSSADLLALNRITCAYQWWHTTLSKFFKQNGTHPCDANIWQSIQTKQIDRARLYLYRNAGRMSWFRLNDIIIRRFALDWISEARERNHQVIEWHSTRCERDATPSFLGIGLYYFMFLWMRWWVWAYRKMVQLQNWQPIDDRNSQHLSPQYCRPKT